LVVVVEVVVLIVVVVVVMVMEGDRKAWLQYVHVVQWIFAQ
jgi:hypothetical protein